MTTYKKNKNTLKSKVENLKSLNDSQKEQIYKQIKYHQDTSGQTIKVGLDENCSIKLKVDKNVMQPFSSRVLAQYIYSIKPEMKNKIVYDLGCGTGIQGIAALLAGAKKVVLSDISAFAIKNSSININPYYNENQEVLIKKSDLFDENIHTELADFIIFAQPYFSDSPIEEYPVTTGMLNKGDLLKRFLEKAKDYLKKDGQILTLGWGFAGEINNPKNNIKEFDHYNCKIVKNANITKNIQSGDIEIYSITIN